MKNKIQIFSAETALCAFLDIGDDITFVFLPSLPAYPLVAQSPKSPESPTPPNSQFGDFPGVRPDSVFHFATYNDFSSSFFLFLSSLPFLFLVLSSFFFFALLLSFLLPSYFFFLLILFSYSFSVFLLPLHREPRRRLRPVALYLQPPELASG